MTAEIRRDDLRDIALVGIGCRFPGGVVDVASFWTFLCASGNAIGDIPADRMDIAAFFDPDPATPGKMMVKRGGYLERIEEFDAAFFGISPREASVLDPQQRLLLETAWEALEDAGQDVAKLAGARTGVFVGQWTSDFEARLFAHPQEIDFYGVQGSGRYASSGRISYALGLRGPSLTLDTACSSALVAVHLAVRSIRSGECEAALAGAANIILQPHVSIAYSQARMLARDGQCKFGDASGDGYVRSEGAAVVVLKSLARATADGDRVYAIIRGSAVGNDGPSSGSMGTPSQTGQEEVLRVAYEDAGLPASRVGYLEAHGTGTRAGDPVELKAIAAVAGQDRAADKPLFVGSAKTNWGHTEAAAGLAGLIKAALILHHAHIPPSLHRSAPNPLLTAAELALIIPSQVIPFPRGEDPGVAGVTALGISGTNAHVVLEEAPASPSIERDPFEHWAPAVLMPLSARSPSALRRLAMLTADRIEAKSASDIGDFCWTAVRRRTALSHRAAFVAESRTALVEDLRGFAENDGQGSVVFDRTAPKIGFVCPGQGAQSAGMARELMRRHPSFLAALVECDRAASRHVDYSIIAQLEADPGQDVYRLDRNQRHSAGPRGARDRLRAAPRRVRSGSLRGRGAQPGRSGGGLHSRRDRCRSRNANHLPPQRSHAADERQGRHGGRGTPHGRGRKPPRRLGRSGECRRQQQPALVCDLGRSRGGATDHVRTRTRWRVQPGGQSGCRIAQPPNGAAGRHFGVRTRRHGHGGRTPADLVDGSRRTR